MCTHGKLFRVETPPRYLLRVAWLRTQAPGPGGSNTLRQEPTLRTLQKRDPHREQSSSEKAALGLSSPKLTSESYRTTWLQPHPQYLYHTSPPNRGTSRIPIKKPQQEQFDPIREPYNSGAPLNRRTDWNCNVCSTESGHDQCPVSGWQQQVTFPRVTFSAFSPASASLSKTWAPLDGAAVEKQRWTFRSWTSATTFAGRLRPPSVGNHPPQPSDDQPNQVHKPLRKQQSVSLRHHERKASGNLPLAYSAPRERRNCTRTESTTKVTKAQ